MNKLILVLAFVCCLAAAESIFAVNKQEIGIFTELQGIDSSDFGKKLLDTIALQIKNKSPLSDISKLLNDIEEELKTQQNKADSAESQAVSECKKQIDDYEKRIQSASTQINDESVAIRGYERQIHDFEAARDSATATIKILTDRQGAFQKAYKEDLDDHANRIAQQRAVIAALENIIPELERLRPHGNVQQALVELAKIGRANPIGALLQVAMTLDAGALQRVIQHLQKLKKSVQASIADDENAQRTAKANYKAMMDEFTKEKNSQNDALNRAVSDLDAAKNKKAHSERIRANARKERDISQKGKKQQQAACDERQSRYNAQRASRQKEIDVVQQVLKIIATRLMNMQDYIKKRTD